MVIGKVVTKIIQSLPTWEVTKYYGRVCVYQLKCIKYKVQTSEAWFNLRCKFMPGSLRNEIECEEIPQTKDKQLAKEKNVEEQKLSDERLSPKKSTKLRENSMYKDNEFLSSSIKNVDESHMRDEYGRINKNRKKWNKEKRQDNPEHCTQEDYKPERSRKAKRAQ